MIDLTYFISIIVISLIGGQAAFMILRYFVLKRQRCYEDEVEKLTDQVEKGKLSKLLFQQMKQDLKEKYNTQFYERWWGRN